MLLKSSSQPSPPASPPSTFVNPKDLLGGVLMLVLGLATIWQASTYDLGSLRRMGPGFFPMALGVILAVMGALIILTTRKPTGTAVKSERLPPEWRGWFCIGAGLAAFCILGQYSGLMPATFACVFIAALGDRQNRLLSSLILAVVMCLVAAIVFRWLLQIQLPLFRWG